MIPKVTIPLGEAPQTLGGHSWPMWENGPGLMAAVQEPATIVIKFPSGNLATFYSRATLIDQEGGRIYGIRFSPTEKYGTFPETLAIVEKLGVACPSLGDCPEFKLTLSDWRNTGSTWNRTVANCMIEDDVSMSVEIKTDKDRGFYVIVRISVLSIKLPKIYGAERDQKAETTD